MVKSFLNKESFNRLGNIRWTENAINGKSSVVSLDEGLLFNISTDTYPKFFVNSDWSDNVFDEISWEEAEKLLLKERKEIQKELDEVNCSITMLKRAKREII